MKSIVSLIAITLFIVSCHTTKPGVSEKKEVVKIEESSTDSTEYELIIFDPKYDTFLATQPPKEFYSNSYYQSWNIRYVTEWNIRHNNPIHYGDFYETRIDYQFDVDYGIDLNYKLYNYFLFIEREYGIRLVRRGKTGN